MRVRVSRGSQKIFEKVGNFVEEVGFGVINGAGAVQGGKVVGQRINSLGELQSETIKISPDQEVGVGIPSVVYGRNKFVAVHEVNRPGSFGNIAVAVVDDKKVDLLDLRVWKTEYLAKDDMMIFTADFNGDTKVDLLDLKEWKNGYLK